MKLAPANIPPIPGHKNGLITDGSRNMWPLDSVQGGYNFDLMDGGDELRRPIDYLFQLNSVLPAGYSIINFAEKEFYDADKNKISAIIAFARNKDDVNSYTRIYINKWYNPGTDYANSQTGATGWRDEWVELTETYSGEIDHVEPPSSYSDSYTTFFMGFNGTSDENYFRGFFVFKGNDCYGIVTDNSDASDSQFTVRLSSQYILGNLTVKELAENDNITLVRFPVVGYMGDDWKKVTDVDFADTFNAVRVACGHDVRILWIGFIAEKNPFGTASNIGADEHEYRKKWNGFWMSRDAHYVFSKDVWQVHRYKTNSSSQSYALAATDYNDFIAQELGLIVKDEAYKYSTAYQFEVPFNTLAGSPDNWFTGFWAVLVQLDGFQNIFINAYAGARSYYESGGLYNGYNTEVEITMLFNPHYDRRISGMKLFYERKNNGPDKLSQDIFTTTELPDNNSASLPFKDRDVNFFQLPDKYGGNIKITANFSITSGHNIYELKLNGFPKDISSDFFQKPENGGLPLKSYLNAFYYKDVHIKCKYLIKSGEDMIAINLSPDNLSSNELGEKKPGFNKIAVSNLQVYGNINAYSYYTEERLKELVSEDITGAIDVDDGTIAIFTKSDMRVVEFVDKLNLMYKATDPFRHKGALSNRGIVKARIGAEFGGIYWVGQSTIWKYVDSQPVDLLQGRWKEKFNSWSDATKSSIIAGFYPEEREVFFIVNYSEIYVYSIIHDNWKPYKYPLADTPYTNCLDSSNGQMLFSGKRNIFTTEPRGTNKHRDLESGTSVAITGEIKSIINLGSDIPPKVLHNIDLIYDTKFVTASRGAIMKLLLNSLDNNNNDLCDPAIHPNGAVEIDITSHTRKFTIGSAIRKGMNYFNYIIRIDSASDIKKLRINQIQLKILTGTRHLSKI